MNQLSLNFEQSDEKATQDEPQVLSVSEINKAVRSTLEGQFKLIWVKGEISNFKPHSSGHWYFGLKDAKAQISAVMFRGFNGHVKFRPKDGMEVIVRGKVTVYEPRGTYQIFCELMEPVGAGAMQLAFEQLKAKLQAEGLLDPERKRPIPMLPQHVAVVTSPTGAAIKDILNVLGRRFKSLQVTLIPAVVQGAQAPASIVSAINMANQLRDVDVLIVGRGGGSIEDLWAFNDEAVARAIASAKVPTISAVGHEIDFTIADFVADLRAPTPSAAAELVCRSAAELTERLGFLKQHLVKSIQHALVTAGQRWRHASQRLVDPKRRLQDLSIRCDELVQRLTLAVERYFELPEQRLLALTTQLRTFMRARFDRSNAQLSQAMAVLDSMSPLRVLDRGFAVALKEERVLKSADQVKVGDQLEVRLSRGRIWAEVNKIERKEGQ